MTISESNAIHNLRVFALMLIVSCHICQFYGNRWAWVLNVGVQLFIIISGYLYGQRIVTDWSEWFKRRFLKLYIPYALYLCAVLPLYFIFESSYISIKKVVLYFFDLQGILGGGKRSRSFVVYDGYSTMLSDNSLPSVLAWKWQGSCTINSLLWLS